MSSIHRFDLMLQNEIVSACRASLSLGGKKRKSINNISAWTSWRENVLQTIRSAFPKAIFERRNELNARIVSRFEFDHFRIENVLFESLPGWEVNGTVYLPKQRGIYPGVVCPTGHSTKTGENYQRSAQIFARNGYIAISFDPPGCAGEIAHLNDHFTNGLIGYLTGFWSQTHFVIDAIRCIDYLLTRDDVDSKAGISITGVSGGGVTSFFTALLDERIAFTAPVCCLNEHESIHLTDLYTSCPEQFGPGYISTGIDYVDYIAAIAPRPCLIMGGKNDEVFDYRSTVRLFEEVKSIYKVADCQDQCGLYIDEESGHAYSVNMANEAVKWMNKFIKKSDESALNITEEQIYIIEKEKLLCHPSNKVNMFTINRDIAIKLRNERQKKRNHLYPIVENLLNVSANVGPMNVSKRSGPHRVWHALIEEIDIQPNSETHLPGLMITHTEDKSPNPGMLWIDEHGKWSALLHDGFLCQALRIFSDDCLPEQPRILSLDVSGFGSLTPEPTAYDLAGWNDIERILTYLSVANSKPIMGLCVRDAICGLDYLKSRPEVDINKIIVGGRGIGAIVALHVACLKPEVKRVICMDMLSHYGAMTEEFPFSWRQSIVIPNILLYYDLPELISSLVNTNVYVINPLSAVKSLISQEYADDLYSVASNAIIKCKVDGGSALIDAIYAKW